MFELLAWIIAHRLDLAVHFLLEVLGQGVLVLAYKHVCRKPWHQVAIWFVGTLLTTIVTVHLIG